MKVGARSLKMSSGKVKTFKSRGSRDRFEKVAAAYKRGWRPTKKKK